MILEISVSNYGGFPLSINSYFGDTYIPLRTIILALLIVIVLRVIKVRKRGKK